jgi:FdhD protein
VIVPGRATQRARVTRWRAGSTSQEQDVLAAEEPLEIRVRPWTSDGSRPAEPLAVTMRTPGDDFPLVAGFLHGEGVLRQAEDVAEMTYCRGEAQQEYNVVEARLAPGVSFDLDALRRNVYTTSACGVCGAASLEALEARSCEPVADGPVVDARLLASLPARLLEVQGVFERTGGLHAAGLFTPEGERRYVMEDVGRHNALDKVVGQALLDRALPARRSVVVVSGRASFELVQKAIVAGIPILVAVGAPSSLAVELAQRFGLTLVGFTREDAFNVYARPERVV